MVVRKKLQKVVGPVGIKFIITIIIIINIISSSTANNIISGSCSCTSIGLAVNTGKTKYMEIRRQRGMIAN